MNKFIVRSSGMVLVDTDVLVEVCKVYNNNIKVEINHNAVQFDWYRYTMDGNGYHIGNEHWRVRVPMISKGLIGLNTGEHTPMCVWGDTMAALKSDAATCRLVSHPRTIRGENGYYPPDQEFGWQEFDGYIEQVLGYLGTFETHFVSGSKDWFLNSKTKMIWMGNTGLTMKENREMR